ncbi:MAG: 6-phosphofructokinase [Candidatus Cloacimonadota bacterium]|nr:6-phosphofructokinase [Candidatus Cloacimonadota bacterium]
MINLQGNMLIAQGGGPTVVINQSLVGAILQARKNPNITKIYGALHGVRGIVEEKFLDLTEVSEENLEIIALTPSSALFSTRDKPDEKYCRNICEILQKYNVRYFFYIGGNDSADTCRLINEYAEDTGYKLVAVHIPKTIDNDLQVTDHCPGFGSAARFVALAFAGVNYDNRSLPGVYIGVVMGRHAGFLTAASVLAKKGEEDGPHLIYIPERVFDEEKFLQDVDANFKKYGRCMIAVSEGISDKDGTPIVTKFAKNVEHDAHGNVQLSGIGALGDLLAEKIKTELPHIKRVRADTFGYLQRSFLGIVSETDRTEARKVGEKAVDFAAKGKSGSVAIKRIKEYQIDYFLTELKNVAKVTKLMPDSFIKNDNFVTDEFIEYASPLVGELPIRGIIDAPSVSKK